MKKIKYCYQNIINTFKIFTTSYSKKTFIFMSAFST